MPSTWFYYCYPKPIIEKYGKFFPKVVPSIKVPTRLKPISTRHPIVTKSSEAKLLVAGKHLTQLFREERVELFSHHAVAVRPYAERLIQLAIEYGDCHKPTMEVCSYLLHEKELIHKLFKVYVPRYRNCATAYTSVYQLPAFYGQNPERANKPYDLFYPVVLELKGNPYPPVISKPEVHRNSLLNVLLDSAKKQYALEKRQKLAQQVSKDEARHKETANLEDNAKKESETVEAT